MKKLFTLLALTGAMTMAMAQTAAPAASAAKPMAAAATAKPAEAAKPVAAAPIAAPAATEKAPMTTQQNKMKTCNADAKTKALKGDERKAFMKTCLSGSNAAAAPTLS